MAIDDAHTRPDGTSDATVEAVGKLSEAFEAIEEARGHLFSFHRTVGRADLLLGDAIEQLRAAGHDDLAREIETEVLGRNIIEGRWTFQIVEDFDDGYWQRFRDAERTVRDRLLDGRRHVYESTLKERNRTHGRRGHEARPGEPTDAD